MVSLTPNNDENNPFQPKPNGAFCPYYDKALLLFSRPMIDKDTYRVFFLNWLPPPHASLNGALVHGLAMHEEEGGGAEALKKTPCIMHICML